jgi:hypothetical protein
MGNFHWSDDDVQWLRDNYANAATSVITERFPQRTWHAIKMAATTRGLTRDRGYAVNHSFFSEWSPDMAYILGNVITDGCISNGRLMFGVARKDKELLEYISSKLVPGKPVRDCAYVVAGKEHLGCSLSVSSKKIQEDLRRHGIIERKTGREMLPACPDEYKPDLLRGLFDGDGGFYATKAAKPYIVMTISSSSISFLESVKTNLGLGHGHIYRCAKNCFKWTVQRQRHVKLLADCMYYQGMPFFLKRKWDVLMSKDWSDECCFHKCMAS